MPMSPGEPAAPESLPSDPEPPPVPDVYESEWDQWDAATERFDGPDEVIFIHHPPSDLQEPRDAQPLPGDDVGPLGEPMIEFHAFEVALTGCPDGSVDRTADAARRAGMHVLVHGAALRQAKPPGKEDAWVEEVRRSLEHDPSYIGRNAGDKPR